MNSDDMKEPISIAKDSTFSAKKDQLIKMLKDGILSGVYRSGSSIPSERRLASLMQFSRPTIHLGLQELEQEKLLRRVGYKVIVTDEALKLLEANPSAQKKNVVVLTRNIHYHNLTYLELFKTLVSHLPESIHCEIRFFQDMNDFDKVNAVPEDAVVVVLGKSLPYILGNSLGRNVIFINTRDENTNYIVPDDYLGGRMVAEHLWKLGHRRIAVALLPGNNGVGLREFTERHRGIADAFAMHHEMISTLGANGKQGLEDICKEIFHTFRIHPEYTALVTLQDLFVLNIASLARGEGLSIPENFSLARFDDSYYATFVTPSITSVRFPVQEIALLTVEAIQEAFKRPPHECFCQKKVAPLLIERESTAAISQKS